MKNKIWKLKDIINFGKYKGKIIKDILELNPEYLVWAHQTIKWFKLEDDLYKKAIMKANELLGVRIRKMRHYRNNWENEDDHWLIYVHSIWN